MKCLKPFLLLSRNLIFLIILLSACSKSAVENHLEDVFGEEIVDSKSDDHDQESEGEENQNDSSNEETDESDNDDEDEDGSTVTGKLTAKVNGEEFKNWGQDDIKYFDLGLLDPKDFEPQATVDFATFSDLSESEQTYTIWIGAYDFDLGIKEVKFMFLYLAGKDFQSLAAGHTFEQIFDIRFEGATAGYTENKNTYDDSEGSGTDEIEEIFVKITAIDHVKKLMSGEFNFKGKNSETDVVYEISDGVFKDIPIIIPEH
ncbi:hypothetical protein B0O79_3166 [Flavobacteriaceae bacterium MAR_2009_75]|nr:hypothetical protein B0O79_3166 [Flavobacteriaceae bacterium MAR_2009_75]